MANGLLYAYIDYGDRYVQPLLVSALEKALAPDQVVFVRDVSDVPDETSRYLEWRQYEDVGFERQMQHPCTTLCNTYVIRKALIRKHFLSNTVTHWSTKHRDTRLLSHFKPGVEFEVDYAEFLDEALVEAYELRASWEKNEGKEPEDREWWILKPGMSDRGQGIRLFSTEEELTSIFEGWDPPSDLDSDDGDDDDQAGCDEAGDKDDDNDDDDDNSNGGATNSTDAGQLRRGPGTLSNSIITTQLRHFIAQPYIDKPLLLPTPHPSANRKFHIRTYVIAVGALRVFVYKPMLALFASEEYAAPSALTSENADLSRHLTNTCLQNGQREGSVHEFWSLPTSIPGIDDGRNGDWLTNVFSQICDITGEVFEAAARSMSVHFQPLPNAFEIFGLDFLVDARGTAWLLEVNSFPDFAQTGDELKSLVGGLFEAVVEKAVKPFFGLESTADDAQDKDAVLVQVLDIDLGRR